MSPFTVNLICGMTVLNSTGSWYTMYIGTLIKNVVNTHSISVCVTRGMGNVIHTSHITTSCSSVTSHVFEKKSNAAATSRLEYFDSPISVFCILYCVYYYLYVNAAPHSTLYSPCDSIGISLSIVYL